MEPVQTAAQRAQQMNRDQKGQFAHTVFPTGDPISVEDLEIATKAATSAYYRKAYGSVRSLISVDDVAQRVLISMMQMTNSTREDRRRQAGVIARRKVVDLTREVAGRNGHRRNEVSIDAEVDYQLTSNDGIPDDETESPFGFQDDSFEDVKARIEQRRKSAADGKRVEMKPAISSEQAAKHQAIWDEVKSAYNLGEIQPVKSSSYVMMTQAIKKDGGINEVVRRWPDVDKRTYSLFSGYFSSQDDCDAVIEIMRRSPHVAKDMVRTVTVVGAVRGLEQQSKQ